MRRPILQFQPELSRRTFAATQTRRYDCGRVCRLSCGACGAYYPELIKDEAEFGDRLRVIFRERPLYRRKASLIAAKRPKLPAHKAASGDARQALREPKDWSELKTWCPC